MDASTFIAPLTFTSDGMTLRAYRPGDGPGLQIATTSSYEHLRHWMPWAMPEDSAEAAEVRCRRFAARYLLNEEFILGIWDGDQLAGGTGFHLRGAPIELRNAEIGMWIRGNYAGQGLGTRALRAMLNWGFAGALSLLLLASAAVIFFVFDRVVGMQSLTQASTRASTSSRTAKARWLAQVGQLACAALGTATRPSPQRPTDKRAQVWRCSSDSARHHPRR